jgi:hypothetical protein
MVARERPTSVHKSSSIQRANTSVSLQASCPSCSDFLRSRSIIRISLDLSRRGYGVWSCEDAVVDVGMLLLMLLTLLGLGVAWVVYKLTRVPAGNIPPIVAGPPLIGNAVRFGMDPINLIMESRAKHGDVFTLKVFHEHMIFFVGTDAHEFFFKTPEEVFNAAAA